MKKLHPTQKKLLARLTRLKGDGYTIRELQDDLDLSTPSLVFFHLQQLEKKGYIERNPMNPADYRVLPQPEDDSGLMLVNLYGLAHCGPSGTILSGDVEQRMELPQDFLGQRLRNPFLAQAHGDSMEPRIQDGDLVLFERAHDAATGTVVACSNDGKAFIKRLVKSGKKVMLHSLNKKYEPFAADPDSFHIEGVAVQVVGRIS